MICSLRLGTLQLQPHIVFSGFVSEALFILQARHTRPPHDDQPRSHIQSPGARDLLVSSFVLFVVTQLQLTSIVDSTSGITGLGEQRFPLRNLPQAPFDVNAVVIRPGSAVAHAPSNKGPQLGTCELPHRRPVNRKERWTRQSSQLVAYEHASHIVVRERIDVV